MNHLVKVSVCGLFLLSGAALAGSNSEAMDSVKNFDRSLYESAKNATDSNENALAIPCGEATGYKLIFVTHEMSKGWHSTGFVPAEYYGKPIYCKKSGLVFPDGKAVTDAQLGASYFATVYNKTAEPKKELLESDKDVTDPELKQLLAEAGRKTKAEVDAGINKYGKEVRIQASKKPAEAN
ncbi:TPA: hypothetical protein MM158_005214 [Klebsiella pneumoniae]|nr:hypothetical protein [Klebsiella pneumoniae]